MRFFKKAFYFLVLFLIFPGDLSASENSSLVLKNTDRLLVIAPHPDDETLGTGGLIQRAMAMGAEVKVLYLTHGDNNEIASIFYQKKPLLTRNDFIRSGRIRKKEAVSAMAVLGLSEKNLIFLGYPDLGTLTIWRKHWGTTAPFRGFPAQINKVPYHEDFSFGSEYKGENIVRDFKNVIESYQPTHIFVTAPFDLNSDHQAAFLYLETALLDLQDKGVHPDVYVYLVHASRWPLPKKYFPTAGLLPPNFLLSAPEFQIVSEELVKGEVERKKRALQQYKSQMAYSKNFLLSFVRSSEFFLRPSKESGARASQDLPEMHAVVYRVMGKELWLDIRLENPLDFLNDLTFDAFGYKKGVSFSTMPKISIRFSENRLSVTDGYRRLRNVDIRFYPEKRRVKLCVPFELLGNPDYVFVRVGSATEQRPLDFNSWRILRIPTGKKETIS